MALDQPRFLPLAAPPHRVSVTDPSAAVRVLMSGSVGSGKRTVAKAMVGRRDGKVIAEADARPITIRTRESVLEPRQTKGSSEVAEAEYLVLVVDGTRAGALALLNSTLSVLPMAWWRNTAILITKTDLRSRAAFTLHHLAQLVSLYSSTIPVLFSSPFNLTAIAQRLRRLALSAGTGSLRPLQGLRVEQPARFLEVAAEEERE